MDKQLDIAKVYRDQLTNILVNMESTTGKMYQIEIREFGRNGSCHIGKFDKREGKIEIYDMKTYREDEEYPDHGPPVKIQKHIHNDLMNLNGIYNSFEDARTKLSEFRRANHIHPRIIISDNSFNVYSASGGSVSICHTIGKWRYI
jgi:hypothetical protein